MENTGINQYGKLVNTIGQLLSEARKNIAVSVNNVLVETYWSIGKHIIEFEQKGNERADYGSGLINRLSHDLTDLYGKGFNRNNLQYMRKFYMTFPNSTTLSCKLSWSHYQEILKLDNPLEIKFYVRECENSRWSVRELKRQRDSMLFHRIANSKDKESVLQLANKGVDLQKPEDILHDPYVLEFVGFPENYNYKEGELEEAIEQNMSRFLLELGKGFAFYSRQYRISLAGRHLYVDLVFYNVILKCFVLIDLKRGEVKHEDIGQMNLYLNYFRHEVNREEDNEPIGIVLGASGDRLTMQYALEGISNQLFVSRYQLYLPSREQLEKEINKILNLSNQK